MLWLVLAVGIIEAEISNRSNQLFFTMVDTTKERTAIVICDLQPDLLGSLKQRDNLLLSLRIPLEAARKNDWLVVYSGLQFKSRYEGVSPKHKLYGALCKLNQKLGDKAVHWFMD